MIRIFLHSCQYTIHQQRDTDENNRRMFVGEKGIHTINRMHYHFENAGLHVSYDEDDEDYFINMQREWGLM